jgi:hypothetical protein
MDPPLRFLYLPSLYLSFPFRKRRTPQSLSGFPHHGVFATGSRQKEASGSVFLNTPLRPHIKKNLFSTAGQSQKKKDARDPPIDR